jgi:hypothetical protein
MSARPSSEGFIPLWPPVITMAAAVKDGIGGRFGIAHRRSPLILENALQPRMNTDRHGCQAVAANLRLTGRVIESHGPKSVLQCRKSLFSWQEIGGCGCGVTRARSSRVHPWFPGSSSDSIHAPRIAAFCLHQGVGELRSADRDFAAFPQLKVRNLLLNA